ncbi:MAG: hypothetical protein DMG70_14575 [Acidobacteria bacterium]|nr:MAG: hypothetical protein DMG70_14575 [Acidobacteriota bacterium]PYY06526.1 MAG: hypothetical protein DMG69_22990 [Acidobacteriota bacterium]
MPSLLADPDARMAYDRLARAKFEEHICANHPKIQVAIPPPPDEYSFGSRARQLISRGYKPKDAVELVLEEILLEHRYEPKKIERARADAEEFLSGLRRGL